MAAVADDISRVFGIHRLLDMGGFSRRALFVWPVFVADVFAPYMGGERTGRIRPRLARRLAGMDTEAFNGHARSADPLGTRRI